MHLDKAHEAGRQPCQFSGAHPWWSMAMPDMMGYIPQAVPNKQLELFHDACRILDLHKAKGMGLTCLTITESVSFTFWGHPNRKSI